MKSNAIKDNTSENRLVHIKTSRDRLDTKRELSMEKEKDSVYKDIAVKEKESKQ